MSSNSQMEISQKDLGTSATDLSVLPPEIQKIMLPERLNLSSFSCSECNTPYEKASGISVDVLSCSHFICKNCITAKINAKVTKVTCKKALNDKGFFEGNLGLSAAEADAIRETSTKQVQKVHKKLLANLLSEVKFKKCVRHDKDEEEICEDHNEKLWCTKCQGSVHENCKKVKALKEVIGLPRLIVPPLIAKIEELRKGLNEKNMNCKEISVLKEEVQKQINSFLKMKAVDFVEHIKELKFELDDQCKSITIWSRNLEAVNVTLDNTKKLLFESQRLLPGSFIVFQREIMDLLSVKVSVEFLHRMHIGKYLKFDVGKGKKKTEGGKSEVDNKLGEEAGEPGDTENGTAEPKQETEGAPQPGNEDATTTPAAPGAPDSKVSKPADPSHKKKADGDQAGQSCLDLHGTKTPIEVLCCICDKKQISAEPLRKLMRAFHQVAEEISNYHQKDESVNLNLKIDVATGEIMIDVEKESAIELRLKRIEEQLKLLPMSEKPKAKKNNKPKQDEVDESVVIDRLS